MVLIHQSDSNLVVQNIVSEVAASNEVIFQTFSNFAHSFKPALHNRFIEYRPDGCDPPG